MSTRLGIWCGVTALLCLLLVPGPARSAEIPLREVVDILFKAAPGS